MSLNWVAQQIISRPRLVAPSPTTRRTGGLPEGGTAQAVLAVLQAQPKRFFTFGQIMAATQRTASSLQQLNTDKS